MNHNFADLNSVMWTAIELETDRSKLINHYFPIPEQYTSEEAFVSFMYTRHTHHPLLAMFSLQKNKILPTYLFILFLVLEVFRYLIFRLTGTFLGRYGFGPSVSLYLCLSFLSFLFVYV